MNPTVPQRPPRKLSLEAVASVVARERVAQVEVAQRRAGCVQPPHLSQAHSLPRGSELAKSRPALVVRLPAAAPAPEATMGKWLAEGRACEVRGALRRPTRGSGVPRTRAPYQCRGSTRARQPEALRGTGGRHRPVALGLCAGSRPYRPEGPADT
eukprot:3552364-Prymnesium_polylepis.1